RTSRRRRAGAGWPPAAPSPAPAGSPAVVRWGRSPPTARPPPGSPRPPPRPPTVPLRPPRALPARATHRLRPSAAFQPRGVEHAVPGAPGPTTVAAHLRVHALAARLPVATPH